MLRFEKHILKGLYNNVILSQSYLSLSQKNAFLFVNRRKGLSKHERAVHVTAEFIDKICERLDEKEKKRLKRKGIDEEEAANSPDKKIARDMIEKMSADPDKFFSDDNIVFDPETGIMGRKEDIGDIKTFKQSEEWNRMEALEKEDEMNEARLKEKEQLRHKNKLDKKSKSEKEESEDKSEDESEDLFADWKKDSTRENVSLNEQEGGGRKVKKLQKPNLEDQKVKKDKFKDIFRQFSNESLEEVENERARLGTEANVRDTRRNTRNKNVIAEEDESEFDLSERNSRYNQPKHNTKSSKMPSSYEKDIQNEDDDVLEHVAEYRAPKKNDRLEREPKFNKSKDRNSEEDFNEFEEKIRMGQKPSKKNSKTNNDKFQDILDEFSAESLGDSSQNKRFAKEEDDDILESLDDFDRSTKNNTDSRKNMENKTQKSDSSRKNVQQFYSELNEEKIKKIEKKLESEEKMRENPLIERARGQHDHFEQSSRQPPITDYDTFKKSLERKKTLERFYYFLRKFDTDNLIKILSYPNLIDKNPAEQIPKFLILLNYIRKNRLLSTYNREDIYGVVEKILDHINELRYTEVSTLAVLLDKMRIDRVEYFRELEKRVIEDAEKFSIRTLSNIIFSFGRISAKQSVTEDFSELFAKMETIVALKVQNMNPKDISQIMVGYSKSQSFSPELLYVLEQACLEKYDMMQSQELSVVAHTFAKNDHFNEEFFDRIRKSLPRDAGRYRIMELALVMEALEKFKMINQEVLRELEKQFLRRGDQANIQDIAIFFKLLTRPEYNMGENAHAKMKEVTNLLFNNIDANCLYKMFANFAEKFEKGTIKKETAELLIRRFGILIRTNSIRGIHFTEIKAELFKVKDENIIRRSKKALQEEFARKTPEKRSSRDQGKTPREY